MVFTITEETLPLNNMAGSPSLAYEAGPSFANARSRFSTQAHAQGTPRGRFQPTTDPFYGLDDSFSSVRLEDAASPGTLPAQTERRAGLSRQPPHPTSSSTWTPRRPAPPPPRDHRLKSEPKPSTPELVIAVMGKTGSGKSTFISKLATRNYEHAVGHELRSSKF